MGRSCLYVYFIVHCHSEFYMDINDAKQSRGVLKKRSENVQQFMPKWDFNEVAKQLY